MLFETSGTRQIDSSQLQTLGSSVAMTLAGESDIGNMALAPGKEFTATLEDNVMFCFGDLHLRGDSSITLQGTAATPVVEGSLMIESAAGASLRLLQPQTYIEIGEHFKFKVRLVDREDNGNRPGSCNAWEALYLLGIDGSDGLVIARPTRTATASAAPASAATSVRTSSSIPSTPG